MPCPYLICVRLWRERLLRSSHLWFFNAPFVLRTKDRRKKAKSSQNCPLDFICGFYPTESFVFTQGRRAEPRFMRSELIAVMFFKSSSALPRIAQVPGSAVATIFPLEIT